MNILGVDQATNYTGYCVIDSDKNILNFGIIDLSHLPKDGDVDQTEKRYQLLQEVKFLIYKHKISLVITEGVYFHRNPDTHKKLAQTQSTLQDFCRANGIICFSWSNAGEWRKIISVNTKSRETDKESTKQFVLEHYNIKDQVENYIFEKYHNEKQKCFDDLNKTIKETQFDIYDAIASCESYFRLLELNGIE